jgi:hypothetical protein
MRRTIVSAGWNNVLLTKIDEKSLEKTVMGAGDPAPFFSTPS